MSSREELQGKVAEAEKALQEAQALLEAFNDSIDNHTYPSIDVAEGVVEEYLVTKAHDDCEGSYNCGLGEYHLDFKVDGVVYTGTLSCQYNRHDKTYYYLDEYEFTYKVKEGV